MFGRKKSFTVISYCDLSSARPVCEKSIVGTKRESASSEVHFEYGISRGSPFVVPSDKEASESPFGTGAKACLEARKFDRRALMSSTLDFSEAGRRVIEGPPFMILLRPLSSYERVKSGQPLTMLIG